MRFAVWVLIFGVSLVKFGLTKFFAEAFSSPLLCRPDDETPPACRLICCFYYSLTSLAGDRWVQESSGSGPLLHLVSEQTSLHLVEKALHLRRHSPHPPVFPPTSVSSSLPLMPRLSAPRSLVWVVSESDLESESEPDEEAESIDGG